MRETILRHSALYPEMRGVDYAKLVYQSAFGGGHLIHDMDKALEWVRREMDGADSMGHGESLITPIGGNFYRLNLAPAREMGYRPETITSMFAISAARAKRDVDMFHRGMLEVISIAEEGLIKADADELRRYDETARANDYAPFSHSEAYRATYRPSYRIIDGQCAYLLRAIRAIDTILAERGRAVVGVDGRCASGKSSYAVLLGEIYAAQLFHMDDYFLPFDRKTPERLSQPGGNVDYERFQAEVLDRLDEGEITYRPYDCQTGELSAPMTSKRASVQIIEGAYALSPNMHAPYDLKIMFDIDPEHQKTRLARRNPEMLGRFIDMWIPLEEKYLDAFAIREMCDITLRAEDQVEGGFTC